MPPGCIRRRPRCGDEIAVVSVIVFDCEHLTDRGAPDRFWCGPEDPDPLLVQIGAVRLSLEGSFDLGDRFERLVVPMGRRGRVALPPFFTTLTGITEARVDAEGVPLARALSDFAAFCADAPLYSWGKDEITSLAPACFVAGLVCPIPAGRFHNAAALLRQAGEPADVVQQLRSHGIAAHFGLAEDGAAHDGVSDAVSVARGVQHLLRTGRLTAAAVGAP